MQDEAENSERRVQPHLDLNPKQLSSTSLQPDARVLVMVLETKAMLIGGHQVVFEGYFKNTNEGQMVSHFFNEINHRL